MEIGKEHTQSKTQEATTCRYTPAVILKQPRKRKPADLVIGLKVFANTRNTLIKTETQKAVIMSSISPENPKRDNHTKGL